MNQPSTTTATAIKTGTLRVPDATLHYEVRGTGPLVVLVGAPMDARSFAPLADLLATDHTVLTTDPRGINRSAVDDRDRDSTPDLRADDLARLIAHADAGAAAVFGSSGGAVSVLALAQAHPELAHTVVAHEPPLHHGLDDNEDLRERTEDLIATHLSGDVVGAWRKFLAIANIEMPEEVFQMMFAGERTPQEAADDDFQYAHMIRSTVRWVPDIDVLRTTKTRVVIGIGDDSAGQLCDRSSRALAAALGIAPTMFPGGHIGFAEDPDTFATRLRAVLGES
ncbi:MAG: alpha/beta fold hydrolase [Actinopolymorphaceae bacterium]